MSEIKRMTPRQFQEGGYLQEVNRCFLHPLGMALEVRLDTQEGEFAHIWDYRDDPEGMCFAFGSLSADKADKVGREREAKAAQRLKALGYDVQPPGDS